MLAPAAARADAEHRAQQRHAFLAAERAIAAGHEAKARERMADLDGYPLRPHLELALAGRALHRLPHAQLGALLARHATVPGAGSLRRRWLERLAGEGRWRLLREQRVDDGDTAGACRAAQAAWRTGHEQEAWRRVEALWPTGESLPDACDPVLAAWRAAGRLDDGLAFERAALAMERGNVGLARYLGRYMGPDRRSLLERWMALRAAPGGLAAFAAEGRLHEPARRRVLVHVFARAAARDPDRGRALWDALGPPALPAGLRRELRDLLGTALARAGAPDALEWLRGARAPQALEARAVAALSARAWDELASAVAAMPAGLAARERWRYWGARAVEPGDAAAARSRLAELARERGYYPFLAADRLRLPYALDGEPIRVDPARVATVAAQPAMRRVHEWLALERIEEARREWHHLAPRLGREEHLASAVLARRWGWHEAAIRSAAAAAHWSDLELRFPLAHRALVERAAKASGLEPERIYGVLRQESAFMRDVRSRAGALGLMQLLPATARQVAREAGLAVPRAQALLEPARNLLLGSLYLAGLERRYARHPVLASAAYNAGPGRVRQWRPTRATPAEIWIERIPFRETRRYVRAVLAYQIIYASRLGRTPPRLSDLMPEITPG